MATLQPVREQQEAALPQSDPGVLNAAYRLGFVTVGPILAGFSQLLLRESLRRGLDRLAFLARDGEFLLTVTRRIAARSGPAPQLAYVHLTRRSTSLAAAGQLGMPEIAEATDVRSGQATWRSMLAYFGIEGVEAAGLLSAAGVADTGLLTDTAQLERIVGSEAWRQGIGLLAVQRREVLHAYLKQSGLWDGRSAALVDIGWRGTIQRNLARLASPADGYCSPAGLYLGLWTEGARPPTESTHAVGLLCDQNRSRRLLEGAAWYAAFVLEAICRADEGTTTGYRPDGDAVIPVLDGPGPARTAEAQTQAIVARIRAGVLDHIDQAPLASAADEDVRDRCQHRLLRLAFLPDAAEISVAQRLVHTEGHAPDWSVPLLPGDLPNPFTSPRRWLAGLASPWRAGYVRASGGRLLASGYAAVEALLLALPPAARASLQSAVRRAAGPG